MIGEISKQLYTTLKNDSTLNGYLPDVKDGSNLWEMRAPTPAEEGKFPALVFRVVSGTQILEVESLNAYNWFIELDIIGNEASMTDLWTIFDRLYVILQDSNLSINSSKAYKCRLDFFNTDYDSNTLMSFIQTRWQVWSINMPDTTLAN